MGLANERAGEVSRKPSDKESAPPSPVAFEAHGCRVTIQHSEISLITGSDLTSACRSPKSPRGDYRQCSQDIARAHSRLLHQEIFLLWIVLREKPDIGSEEDLSSGSPVLPHLSEEIRLLCCDLHASEQFQGWNECHVLLDRTREQVRRPTLD